jgi:hypothetical protein
MSNLFSKHDIPPVSCNYNIYLIMFLVKNQTKLHTNLPAHGLETRNMNQLYLPNGNLSCFQKEDSYTAMRIFNTLHNHMKGHNNKSVQFNLTM